MNRNIRVLGGRRWPWRGLLGELSSVGELRTVDGLATSALWNIVSCASQAANGLLTHVATGEVTTLEHEVRDDTVELGARVAEGPSRQQSTVLDGFGTTSKSSKLMRPGALWRSG